MRPIAFLSQMGSTLMVDPAAGWWGFSPFWNGITPLFAFD
jgi:hypothetical protein